MITRWFIGVSADSKGCFNGWVRCKSKPSFQSMYLYDRSYDSEEEAELEIKKYEAECFSSIRNLEKQLVKIQDYKKQWNSYSHKKKIEIHRTEYALFRDANNYYLLDSWNKDFDKNLDCYDFNKSILSTNTSINIEKERLKFLKEKIVIKQKDIDLKFKDSEKRKMEWVTPDYLPFCSCCGGSIPNVQYLEIHSKKRYEANIYICSICMKTLADISLKKAKDIPEELNDHYTKTRFINEIG